MAEVSIFWPTGTTGDGTSTYTDTQLFSWLRRTFNSDMAANRGPLRGYNGELAVTAATGSVNVATGAAYVYGIPYENGAVVNVAIPTPTANTRIDRIVLRANWTARTVRITRIAGTEGAGAPSITQNPGTTYDVRLAQVSITTGGVITVTDERQFCRFATEVTTENIADGSITDSKIVDGAVSSAKILDGTIVNADISASAAIAQSKISNASPTINADQVDGYHAGNASGQVPVSNGTVCTNLNADMVDGYHANSMMRLIETRVLNAPAASVTFSNIPQTFEHLLLIICARSNANTTTHEVWLQPNGDSGSNYLMTGHIYGTSNAHNMIGPFGGTGGVIGFAANSTADAGSFAQIQALINNYQDTDKFKMWIGRSTNFVSGLSLLEQDYSGVWRSTAAITSLVLSNNNSFAAGSTFSLYGVP